MSNKRKGSKEHLDKNTILVALIGFLGVFVTAYFAYLAQTKPTPIPPTLTPLPNSIKTDISDMSSPALQSIGSSITLNAPCTVTYPPQYGFECDSLGWVITDWAESRAITSVKRTQVMNYQNQPTWVLELTIDFTGTKELRKQQYRENGEVQIDLTAFYPAGFDQPTVDLSGKFITARVKASLGAGGEQTSRNGFQLFVKDEEGLTCYGRWNNIDYENVWFQIDWNQADAAECKDGFNSSKPKILGLKIAVGEKSNIEYPAEQYLKIYLDDVYWKLP